MGPEQDNFPTDPGEYRQFPAGPPTPEQVRSMCWRHIAGLVSELSDMGVPDGTVRVGDLVDLGPDVPAIMGGMGSGHSFFEDTADGRALALRQLYELLDPENTDPGTAQVIVVGDLEGTFGEVDELGTSLHRHIRGKDLAPFLEELRTYVRGVNSGAIVPGTTTHPRWVLVLADEEGLGQQQIDLLNRYAATTDWGKIISIGTPLSGPNIQTAEPDGMRVRTTPLLEGQMSDRCSRIAKAEAGQHPDISMCYPPEDKFMKIKDTDDSGLTYYAGLGPDLKPFAVTLGGDTNSIMITGATGKGKTNTELAAIMALTARYDPSECSFILLDFKHGSGVRNLVQGIDNDGNFDERFIPHVRLVGKDANSDPEFGIEVLNFVIKEIGRRTTAIKEVGADNMAELRRRDKTRPWPHLILQIDEFQELITHAGVGSVATDLLMQIGRLGRESGISMILSTQTVEGVQALFAKKEALLTNIAVRIAMGGGIIDGVKKAPKDLPRGIAKISLDGGVTAATVSIPDANPKVVRAHKAKVYGALPDARPPHIFDGKDTPEIESSPDYIKMRARSAADASTQRRKKVLLAQEYSVAGGSASFVLEAGLPGNNLNVITSNSRDAHRVMAAASTSIAAQTKPGDAEFGLVCLDPRSRRHVEIVADGLRSQGHKVVVHTTPAEAAEYLSETSSKLKGRKASDGQQLLFVYGGDHSPDEMKEKRDPKTPNGSEALKDIITNGSVRGVHAFTTWSSSDALKRDSGGYSMTRDRMGVILSSEPNSGITDIAGGSSMDVVSAFAKASARDGRLKMFDRNDPRARGIHQVITYASPDERIAAKEEQAADIDDIWA